MSLASSLMRRRQCAATAWQCATSRGTSVLAEKENKHVEESPYHARLTGVHRELRCRLRRERFAHDTLLRQLRCASADGQLDPVEWRKLRSGLVRAAPELRPGEFATVLEGLVALRSVEPAYLTPVVQPLRHMAYYMSGAQLVTTLAALSALAPSAPDGFTSPGILFSEAQAAATTVASLVEKRFLSARRRLGGSACLTLKQLLQLLAASQQLHLLTPQMIITLLGSLPPAVTFSTPDLEELLTLLRRVAEALKSDPYLRKGLEHLPVVILGVLIEAQSAVRIRLTELSQGQVLRLLVQSVGLEAALEPHSRLQAAILECGGASMKDMLIRKSLEQVGVGRDGAGFHRLLLGEIRNPAEVIRTLSATESTGLFLALALLARRQAPATNTARGPDLTPSRWPPAYLARLCPPLVERTLHGLEALRPDELLQVVEVLVLDLGYEDDYLGHRLAEALARRLVPVWGSITTINDNTHDTLDSGMDLTAATPCPTVCLDTEEQRDETEISKGGCQEREGGNSHASAGPPTRAEHLQRALGALAWLPRPVGFADLLGAALEDLDERVTGAVRLGLSPDDTGMTGICMCLGCSRNSIVDSQWATDEGLWLQGMVSHFRKSGRAPHRRPTETTRRVASWALEKPELAAAQQHWHQMQAWCTR